MTPNTELEPLATIDDVCTWLQKSKPLVKKLAREGRIPAIKIGKS
jgi:excisionase family DNA binding protein